MTHLDSFIKDRRQSKSVLLMTHVIYGYPTVEKSLDFMRVLLNKGVDLLEVQFPFSDPVADGPTITTACHDALENAPTFDEYLNDLNQLSKQYPDTRILIMSYLNPLLQYGAEQLASKSNGGLHGIIVPDLPLEAARLMEPMNATTAAPVWLLTPDTSDERIAQVTAAAKGMIYCVSRKGVTGQTTNGMEGVKQYIDRVRNNTDVPLGVGFGIQSADDIRLLHGIADVAIVGSGLLNAYRKKGLDGVSTLTDELLAA